MPCASATCCSAPDKSPSSPADGNLIAGDIKAQTERVLENVKAILDDQKLTFANVVKSTVFLTDLANFAGMNEIYAKIFHGQFPGALDHSSRRPAQGRKRGDRSHRAFLKNEKILARKTR